MLGLMMRRGHSAVALAALLTLAAHGVRVDATTVNTCLGRKLASVGRALARRTTCYSKDAARPDAAALAGCLAKAEGSFSGGSLPSAGSFARVERVWSCLTTGDQRALDATIADYAAALDAQVANPGTPNRCDASKLACVGRYVVGTTGCWTAAATRTGVVDDACLTRYAARLSDGARGCLDKAAAPGHACSVVGDAAALRGVADQFVADALCALDPAGTAGCGGSPTPILPTPTPSTARTPTPTSTGDPAQLCVDTINAYRASIGLPPFARWTANETCVDGQGLADSQSGTPHSAFGQCSEWAQNECPGWPGTPMSMIGSCLQAMWNEGPGTDYSTHGHYINMMGPYASLGCGIYQMGTGVTIVQDYGN